MSSNNSKLLELAKNFPFLKKIYFFYNIYIRNYKFLFKSSQFNEDKQILELFDKNYKGVYLDIGCYHPTRVNNTLSFYRKGWRGMNIDLNQLTIDLFNYARPGDINICAALSDKVSKTKLYYLGDLDPKNTLDLDHKEWISDHFSISEKDIKTKYVQTQKLDKILIDHKLTNIDYMNIDIEGHEIEVLKSIDFNLININVICIEVHDYDKKKKNEILSFLKKNGYFLKKKISINYIFQKNVDIEHLKFK